MSSSRNAYQYVRDGIEAKLERAVGGPVCGCHIRYSWVWGWDALPLGVHIAVVPCVTHGAPNEAQRIADDRYSAACEVLNHKRLDAGLCNV